MKTTSCTLENVHFPKSSNKRNGVIRKTFKSKAEGKASTGKNTIFHLSTLEN